MPEECIFCDILAGEAPASFVHRDERFELDEAASIIGVRCD